MFRSDAESLNTLLKRQLALDKQYQAMQGPWYIRMLQVALAADPQIRKETWDGYSYQILLIGHNGHDEVVGTIEAVGDGVRQFQPGERVYVYPGVWCGQCPACRAGAENLCRQMQIMGFHRDGGFAPHVTVPAQSVIPVPEGLAAGSGA